MTINTPVRFVISSEGLRMKSLLQSVISDTKVPLAFGGAAISGEGGGYGFGDIAEGEAIDLLHQAHDLGMRIFDTAPIYGFGLSEKRIGKAFKSKREKVFIVSKSGVTWHENKRVDMNNDPKIAQKMLEQSLRDLESDYIDLYMVHWPDSKFDIRRTLEVFAKAKDQGKIKHIGLCNTNIAELEKAAEIEKVEVVQSEFNFFQTRLKEELFPYLTEKNISFMSWGTLDKGILTGRVNEKRTFDKSDCRSWAPWWKNADNAPKFKVMKNLWPLLDAENHSGLELALGFNLSQPELDVALCGAKNNEQLTTLFKALENLPRKEFLNQCADLAKSIHK